MKIINASHQFKRSSSNHLEIFTILSHEIRTPLNAIIGISDLLQKQMNKSDPHTEEYYKILKSSSENLLEMVNNILDFSKLNSGVLEVSQKPFDLKQKLKDNLHFQKQSAISKGLEFILDFDPKIPAVVIGDQVKVTQIFFNLISNSIKFTENGKLKICVSLKEEEPTSFSIECKVIDTGIGIPAEHLDQIFDAFNQGGQEINLQYAGTGLGLNITRNIIQLLGGTLKVESNPGKGTCFTFVIPFDKTSKGFGGSEKNMQYNSSILEGKKVLLVEDNKINVLVVSRNLENWKMVYEIAGNGKEAIEKIKTSDFDVVLMDIYLPKMNGLEATKRIRSFPEGKFKNLPVIALTAATDEKTRELINLHFDDYLTKPFESKKLNQLLCNYCG